MNRPEAAPIVLGYEWLVGATTVTTLACAAAFARVDGKAISALVDEEDGGGPAVTENFKRLAALMPAALTRRGGTYVWRRDDENKASLRAIDGTRMKASGFSSIDVAGTAAATGARDVSFDIATGISSSRRLSEAKSTEIVIDLTGRGRTALRCAPAMRCLSGRRCAAHRAGVSMILAR